MAHGRALSIPALDVARCRWLLPLTLTLDVRANAAVAQPAIHVAPPPQGTAASAPVTVQVAAGLLGCSPWRNSPRLNPPNRRGTDPYARWCGDDVLLAR